MRFGQIVALVCLAVSAVACSTLEKPKKPKPIQSRGYQERPTAEMAERMPWEIWQPYYDLKGGRLTNQSLILGDELQERGKRQAALEAYLKAGADSLDAAQAEAAAIRIASQHLALDDSKKALSSVGSYFKRQGLGEQDVEVPFALLLAFAYGRHADIDQSLAWFSKVSTHGRPGGPAASVAGTGTGLLLRTLPDAEFERIATSWHGDTFVADRIGKERLRRTSMGWNTEDYPAATPFWAGFAGVSLSDSSGNVARQGISGSPSVGLVLSLSDRFGALGRETKQGFELAVEANSTMQQKVSVVARDVGADTAAASAAVRELATGAGVSVIAGPLLTEAATSAAQAARDVGVPIISLSKSESFSTGNGVFRLGATTTSQVEALVNSAFGDYGISRFAIAYPQSASGTEFLELFRKKLGSLGLSLELEVGYVASDEASLIDVAQQLEGSSAEAVLLPDSIEVSERLLRNFSPSLKKRMRPLGTALWDNAAKIARSQAVFERAIFVSPFFAQSSREEVQRFIESYKGRYNITPNFLAAQGFDAGTLVMNAMTKGGGSFSSALESLPPYNGVTGVLSVSSSGEILRSFYVVEVLRDSFQEKLPPSNPQQSRVAVRRSPAPTISGAPVSNTPMLGDQERVDSGY